MILFVDLISLAELRGRFELAVIVLSKVMRGRRVLLTWSRDCPKDLRVKLLLANNG